MKNPLKQKLARGEVTIGVFVQIGHPDVTEMLSQVGFDWLLIDSEHGPFGIETMQRMLQAMGAADTVPLIRVPANDPALIKRALDIGAYGVLVPFVSSKKDAEQAVRAMKYPLGGIRGVGPRRASRYYLQAKDYFSTADKELLTLVQIETKEAVDNFSEIVSVPGVDGYFIGPMDLAAGLGYIGQEHCPQVEKAVDEALVVGKEAGKIGCIYAFDADNARERVEQGFQLVAVGMDSSFLIKGAKDSLAKINKVRENKL